MSGFYCYVFVREDLTPVQQIIQVQHAAVEMAIRAQLDSKHANVPPSTVLFGVADEKELLDVAKVLDTNGVFYAVFHEPWKNTGYTALVTVPLVGRYDLFEGRALHRLDEPPEPLVARLVVSTELEK